MSEVLELTKQCLNSKNAEDIIVFDMHEVSPIVDYYVVCSAETERKMQAITNELVKLAKENKITVKSVEGKESADWILVDLGDVVVHILKTSDREKYDFEKLWNEVPQIKLKEEI